MTTLDRLYENTLITSGSIASLRECSECGRECGKRFKAVSLDEESIIFICQSCDRDSQRFNK